MTAAFRTIRHLQDHLVKTKVRLLVTSEAQGHRIYLSMKLDCTVNGIMGGL